MRWWVVPVAALVVSVVVMVAVLLDMRPSTRSGGLADPEVRRRVEGHVRAIAQEPHQLDDPAYARVASYVERQLQDVGYTVERQAVPFADNLVAELAGGPGIVVLGAHYDSCRPAPGADDNASGVAAILEVARLLAGQRHDRTVRFIAWANEEPPGFQTRTMGSLYSARASRERREDLVAVLALDSVGYYDDRPGTQIWPLGFGLVFSDRANFINVVSNTTSASQVVRVARALRRHSSVPIAYAAVPAAIPGIAWSDHWSYWQAGYDAVMITDMPPFRNPNYHTARDVPDTVDYERLARFTQGLAATVVDLADE